MLVFVLSSLVSFLALFALATHVLGEEPNRLVNRLFGGYCYAVAVVALIEFAVAISPTRELSQIGAYVATGWPIASGVFFHFAVAVTARSARWERWAIGAAYLVSAAIAVGFFFYVHAGGALAEMPPHSSIWGSVSYTIRTPSGTAWYELLVAVAQPVLVVASLAVLLRSLKHGSPGLGWRETKWIVAAYGSMMLFVAAVIAIRRVFGVPVPDVIGASYLLFAVFIFFALRRRALLILTPHRAIGSIVTAMEELLLLTDPQFKVIFINPRVADVFGVTDEAASGRPLSEIVPLGEMPSDREESRAYNEVHARNGEGQEIVLSMNATALRDRGGGLSGWVFIGRDVTLEWERTERIAQSLAEKDTLLREVHHRVGNSLQLIISLLNLQADLLDDPSSQTVLEEATQRIILISRVYERAYNAENVSAIPIDEFFIDIARELKLEAATDRRITTLFDVEPLELDLQRAIPLTMVFTEIYQEALARLVAAGSGKIRLSLRPEDVADAPRPRRWHLAIVHDGDQEQRRQSGIVEALCAQLGAELSVIEQNGSADGADAEKGATVRLSFSV